MKWLSSSGGAVLTGFVRRMYNGHQMTVSGHSQEMSENSTMTSSSNEGS